MAERRALVIDDEPDITTYLAAILTDHGWTVRTANSGDDGLARAQEEPPDVILLDMMMPDRGGLSCLVAIRKDPKLQRIPVIVVSGIQEKLTSDYHQFLERAKRFRPEAYLDKPVNVEELMRTVEKVVAADARATGG